MKIKFHIHYRTKWGEEVGVTLENQNRPFMLNTEDGELWKGTMTLTSLPHNHPVKYRYGIYIDGICVRKETGNIEHLFLTTKEKKETYIINDNWRDLPVNSFLYSSAFNQQILKPEHHLSTDINESYLTIRAISPCLSLKGISLGISGNNSFFGNWDENSPSLMHEIAPNIWSLTVNTSFIQHQLEYKFVLCDKNKTIKEWEEHDNRVISFNEIYKGSIYYTPEYDVSFNNSRIKIAGTAIPVFSLKSDRSFGVGDFSDLKLLIDWAEITGQKAVQILPINDTTITKSWTDSYPYNSISIYAFHPMYLDVSKLGKINDARKADSFERKRLKLNALKQVEYEAVNKLKSDYTKEIFKQHGREVLKSEDFIKFFNKNSYWLIPYASFCTLRDKYGTADHSKWPSHSTYNQNEIINLCKESESIKDEIELIYYIQYNLHLQLLEASNYARKKNIILKGDIPIGISKESVESWVEPYYFNMNGQAGAPPDAFSRNGQNWGFPTYNWEVMEKDNYLWWQRRFTKMAEYFTAYRIDHILGFFRIWEIPTHSVHGLLGQFVPSIPMNVNEIESYGLHFQEDFMTKPFINEEILDRLFGKRKEEIKEKFLKLSHHDIYEIREEYNTQRKVQLFFKENHEEESDEIKENLYSLISNVLFVRDRDNNKLYHPRISVQNEYIFERLNWQEKEAFNRLYNDYYYKRHNKFWYNQAMKKLPVLTQSTSMLVCGEDLGMIPECVPWVMNELQILSLEIQRMPKDPNQEFGHVWEYPYKSVCTISTHDMSTLREWWEEDYKQSCRYYNCVLGHYDEAPHKATGELCKEIVARHLESPSLMCILSFQDWLSIDENLRAEDIASERINVPSNPKNYWRYRMHLTLQELIKSDSLNKNIKGIIVKSGR